MRVVGVIPAAGLSRRMGQAKLALPLQGRSVLERVVEAVRTGGVAEVLVVLGPTSASLRQLAERAGARTLLLEQETPDMRATVQAGLTHLERLFQPRPDDAWLLLPADHPTLDAAVVQALVAAASGDREHSIFVPEHGGRRGHPTLLRWSHVAELLKLPEGQGLNAYIRSRDAQTRELPWPGADVLCDLDTPEDYAALRRAFEPGERGA
jgi:molybdenum cofactor cytidylyltransferase